MSSEKKKEQKTYKCSTTEEEVGVRESAPQMGVSGGRDFGNFNSGSEITATLGMMGIC